MRQVSAVVLAGLMGALTFLIAIEGSFRQGYTDLDYSHVLGTLIEGTSEEARSTDAFSVVGDTAGPAGLYATLLGGLVLAIVHAVAVVPLVRRGWIVRGLAIGAVAALVVGFVFCAVADARLDTPTGLFGVDAGWFTPVVIVLSSLLCGLVLSRVHSLVASASWWEPKKEDIAAELESIAALEPDGPSLELPEEGPEQRRVGA